LNVFTFDDPVPTMSIAPFCVLSICVDTDRITLAIPANSSCVSPFAVSAVSYAAICAGIALISIRALKKSAASRAERSSLRKSLDRNAKSGVSALALVAYTGAESSQSVRDAGINRLA
jgi:hypothetical protein